MIASESGDTRARKKLLAKTNWYKKKRNKNMYDRSRGGRKKSKEERN